MTDFRLAYYIINIFIIITLGYIYLNYLENPIICIDTIDYLNGMSSIN